VIYINEEEGRPPSKQDLSFERVVRRCAQSQRCGVIKVRVLVRYR
jgi:hypothetical protein